MLGLFTHFTQNHIWASELEVSRFHLQGTMNDHLTVAGNSILSLFHVLNIKGEETNTDIKQ